MSNTTPTKFTSDAARKSYAAMQDCKCELPACVDGFTTATKTYDGILSVTGDVCEFEAYDDEDELDAAWDELVENAAIPC